MMPSYRYLFFPFLFACGGATTPPPSLYPVEEHIFHSVIDHFNFRPTTVPTFPLRYYVHDQHWNTSHNTKTGPCFFYAGNEADIFQFVNHSGFLFEAAQEFGAMVVFAEHRYYGLSNPFGNDYALGKGYNVSFLTVEQAMEDYNTLVTHIRQEWSMTPKNAFVVFGGSYGGNLALWLRLKNPNIWAGAIASSVTPLKHLLRETNGFARIETEAYANVSSKCPELIRTGWKELYEGAATPAGRKSVAQALSLCSLALPDQHAAQDIHGWISGALETLVQYGYPYPTNFYNPVPAYPFQVACQEMLKEGTTGLGALKAAANVYYNYTGQAGNCFEFDSLVMKESAKHWERKGQQDRLYDQALRIRNRQIKQETNRKRETDLERRTRRHEKRQSRSMPDQHLINSGIVDNNHTTTVAFTETQAGWGYQTCTEVYQPMPTDGVTDFELPYTPNQTAYFLNCQRRFDVVPRPDWEEMTFMGDDIGTGSNIFITNGQLDPWRAAGIQKVPKGAGGSIIVRTLEGAAHHLDLRAANDLDPPSVVAVRKEQKAVIQRWITQWRTIHQE
jgi:pimeloyl-ACP methyl ester carboxylesterase